ncbi:ADP-ribosylglycohydrolase [Actinoplanes derwentensis]|uniref:ADP-ribosylglycohydrolase n=2 Tax=Actinoplanes derwentensis TaxID=113562 RepID=A0A1H2C9N0_9ACTN|nr:ADP-ribosylglycohydrolase [Actinoplanes derwentensis]
MLARVTTKVTTKQLSTARGCVLGLVLGDAIGAADAEVASSSTLRATSAAQLACFTIEGVIRAHVRMTHKGICHPPGLVWHAYARWASMQGISGITPWEKEVWPDGWLAQVPVLAARRGSAPATVTALQNGTMGQIDKPAGSSVGAHALTRVLPAGLVGDWVAEPGRFAAEIAATTHAGEAVHAAAVGARIVANIVKGQGIEEAVQQSESEGMSLLKQPFDSPVASAVETARSQPRQTTKLAHLTPDARAAAALAGGVYVALSFPERDQIRDALLFAASGSNGNHVAAVAGALLGAAHGADALPLDWVSRLELAWVADVLARDLIAEFVDKPSGTEYTPGGDPHWWNRYPGW